MDVNTAFNISFTGIRPEVHSAEKNSPATEMPVQHAKVKAEPRGLMDLKDVKDFLYMLIGAEVQVKKDAETTGSNLNLEA